MARQNEDVAYPGKDSTPETVEEVLRGIADRNAGSDLGRLAQLLFDSASGNLQATDEVSDPYIAPEVGTRRDGTDGYTYEWQDDGWHRVEPVTQVQDTVTGTSPVTPDQSVAPTVGSVGPGDGAPGTDAGPDNAGNTPSENPNVEPGSTPPFSGTPGAPNTTVSEGSAEGTEV